MSARSRRRHRRTSRKRNPFLVVLTVLGSMLALGVLGSGLWLLSVYNSAPSLASLTPIKEGTVSKVYAADGSLLGVIHSDKIRQPIASARIPQDLKEATVAIEDRRFYSHGGIDPSAIIRAGWEDLTAGGKPVEGGSTITQQLVRNLYIQDPEDTLKRKIIEARLANDEEDQHSKDWILTEYLNTASYGTNEGATAIGVEAAAETYYSKHAEDLTLPEAAMIAGLPQAPSQYNPLLNPRAALARRNEVLHAMEQQGEISESEYQDAIGQGLGLDPGSKYSRIRKPYIFDLVKQELQDRYGVNTVQNGGLKVYTTIQPRLQKAAQNAVDSCSVCYSGGGPASALASVDPSNGEIVALASTQRYSLSSQFNFAAHAQRQPGSSFKVYDLTAAIKQGIDPDTTYYDGTSPKTLETPGRLELDGQQRRGGRRGVASDRGDLGVGQRGLRAARPRRRSREHRQDRLPDGDHLAARNQGSERHPLQARPALLHPASRRDRRPQRRRHAARAGQRLRHAGQRRRPPRRRPRSTGSSSPAARSTSRAQTKASACSLPARPTR